jgi:hypothetical protein
MIIFGILLVSCLTAACKEHKKEPLAPEIGVEGTETPGLDGEPTDGTDLEDEASVEEQKPGEAP